MDWKHAKVGKYMDIGDGREIHYHERGEGEPVIFLHGGGQGSGGWTNWKGNLDHFAEAGFHAIAPDALGYGLSSKPEDGTFSFAALMDCLEKFIDGMGFDKVYLVGNSMGGAMSIRYCQDNLDRVNKLIVMGPAGLGHGRRYLEMPAIQMLKDLGKQGGGVSKEKLRTFLEFLTSAPSVVDDDLIEERFEVLQTQPARVFQTLDIEDLRPRLSILKDLPTRILWGRDDKACPVESGLEMLAECNDAEMTIYSETGHWVQAERQDEFNKLGVEFFST